MTPAVSTMDLRRRYGGDLALDGVTLDIPPNAVTGLFGHNGAGKSTLLRVITAQDFASSGTVRVFGADPVENNAVLRRIAFVREDQRYPDLTVRQAVLSASWLYPNWHAETAERLLAGFGLPGGRRIDRLSRGMRSALGIVLGLAARAELTVLDEPYAGLDAGARQRCYDALLAEFAEHPRTVLISTHLIDEIADLLEHVVLLERGRVALHAPAEDLRGTAATVSGPAERVAEFLGDRPVVQRRTLGSRSSVTVTLDEADRARAEELRLRLEPLSLQELLVRTTSETSATSEALG